MKINLSKKVKAGIIVGAMALSVLGAYSAFTATTQTNVNTFNIVAGEDGQEAGEVTEPGWDEEKAKDLQPGETVPKNPKVVSSVEYESWVFMTVEIPTFHATLNDVEGVYDTVAPNFNADGRWTLIKSEKSDTA